jgi:hypothetical protein
VGGLGRQQLLFILLLLAQKLEPVDIIKGITLSVKKIMPHADQTKIYATSDAKIFARSEIFSSPSGGREDLAKNTLEGEGKGVVFKKKKKKYGWESLLYHLL